MLNYRHLNMEVTALRSNILNMIFHPVARLHHTSSLNQGTGTENSKSYLTWMTSYKMWSYFRQLSKRVSELKFAKARVLTPKIYRWAGRCSCQGHLQVNLQSAEVQKSRQRFQRARGYKSSHHHDTRQASAKDLIFLVSFTELSYLSETWVKI